MVDPKNVKIKFDGEIFLEGKLVWEYFFGGRNILVRHFSVETNK